MLRGGQDRGGQVGQGSGEWTRGMDDEGELPVLAWAGAAHDYPY